MSHHWPGVTHVYNGKESLGIARWQHISQLKAMAIFSLYKNIVIKKNNNVYFVLAMPSGG
jgi:hypothetical protein